MGLWAHQDEGLVSPVALLMPGVTALAYGLLRGMGLPLPAPQLSLPGAVVLFVLFWVAALSEELGWSGYILDRLRERWNALWAGLLFGVVWAMWHFISLLQADRSPDWIAWWSVGTVAARVIMVWLYNNTGQSVFAVAVYHACRISAGNCSPPITIRC